MSQSSHRDPVEPDELHPDRGRGGVLIAHPWIRLLADVESDPATLATSPVAAPAIHLEPAA